MKTTGLTNLEAFGQNWLRTVASMAWGHWLILDTSLQAAQTVLAAAAARRPPVAADAADELIRRARERVAKGLAPPREIYQVPYRARIDWSQFPAWAWPSDPELFEGTAHEG